MATEFRFQTLIERSHSPHSNKRHTGDQRVILY